MAYWPNKAQRKFWLWHKGQRRASARIVSLMPHRDNLQNRRRILKSGDSWPLVLVRRRPSRALHPGMAVCTRAFGHDVLVGRFCGSSNSRRRSARANSPHLWRQSHLAFRAVCLRDAGTTGWSRVAAPDSASAARLRRSAARVVGGLRRSGHDDWNDLVGVHVGESGHGSVCIPSAQ